MIEENKKFKMYINAEECGIGKFIGVDLASTCNDFVGKSLKMGYTNVFTGQIAIGRGKWCKYLEIMDKVKYLSVIKSKTRKLRIKLKLDRRIKKLYRELY